MFNSQEYGKLTSRSKEWITTLETMAEKGEDIRKQYEDTFQDDLNIKIDVVKENTYSLLHIFLTNLDDAIERTEYKRYSEFGNFLKLRIEYNIDLLLNALIVDGEYGAIRRMKDIAGDLSDFYEGVEQAREILINEGKMTGKGNAEQRAKFWANVVWPNDDLYNNTIDLRMKAWGDTAPYWMLIEHGNFGSSGAFPQFSATGFFYTSVIEAKGLIEELTLAKKKYREALMEQEEARIEEEFTEKELNLITQAQKKFLDSPEMFVPGEVLGTFKNLETQKSYEIYVTSRKKIGTRIRR